jgi:hypothetical protein
MNMGARDRLPRDPSRPLPGCRAWNRRVRFLDDSRRLRLAAQDRALRRFGAMAILGEVSCLATAIETLPAAVAVWGQPVRRQ